MKLNMGQVDRVIRLLIAVVIAVAFFTGQISGTYAVIALIIAGVFIVTAFIGFCPLYSIFGISTKRRKQTT